MMKNEKAKILMYGLTAELENLVQELHGAAYEIVKTDCFTDILAIPAAMVVVNPEKMSVTEQKQMNEVFQHDNFTLILFTNEFDKEVMPNLKYWARFEDYMNRARIEGNQEEYTNQYNDLVRQYDEAKAMFNAVVDTITAKGKQKARLGAFITALKKQEGIVDEFTPDLWGSMVDFITVGRKKEIKVTFRDGTEIMA